MALPASVIALSPCSSVNLSGRKARVFRLQNLSDGKPSTVVFRFENVFRVTYAFVDADGNPAEGWVTFEVDTARTNFQASEARFIPTSVQTNVHEFHKRSWLDILGNFFNRLGCYSKEIAFLTVAANKDDTFLFIETEE